MRKSPGKWIKTVLFGKKSSKSTLSKDATTLNKKVPITTNSQAKDFNADSVVISSPVRPVIDASGEHAQLDKSSSANLITHDTAENVRNTLGLNTGANDDELIRLEQAATKAQAAFRGYLARRAFWALKGIIRLQALVRGHLVRRQAVATLSCMRAIVEFQALVRGQKVRLYSGDGQTLQKKTPRELVHKERANLLQTSLRSEKLSTNAFAAKLVASSNSTMPLSIQYDPIEPNSVRNWLDRWSTSHFWEPLPPPPPKKTALDAKPKRKQTKLQSEETETARPKRSVRRAPPPNPDTNHPLNSSDNEKPKRTTARKASTIQSEEQSHSELEKVKRNLRKISVAAAGPSEKSEVPTEKFPTEKISVPEPPCPDQPIEKVNEAEIIVTKQPEPEPPISAPPTEEKPLDVINPPPAVETNGKVENESHLTPESNGKENQKARRRRSFPVKQEYAAESVSQNSPSLPSYMAATESAKAKLRAQAAAKAAEDGENGNGSARRHSLPSSATGKLSLQSPRVQKPLQNGKGGSKTNKPQISPRDEKALTSGWRR